LQEVLGKELIETREEEFTALALYYTVLLDILPRYLPPTEFEINIFKLDSRENIMNSRALAREFLAEGYSMYETALMGLAKKIIDPISTLC